MTFNYDTSEELCTFDFFGWLVQALAAGASEIVFDVSALATCNRRRFETILAPGPALAKLPSRQGSDGVKLAIGSSRMGRLVQFARQRRSFTRLAAFRTGDMARYTVTLRRQATSPHRNSNDAAWHEFAREIGAIVIEDYDARPLHLHTRMALYAGAEMNFGVWCGPLTLCTLTNYPVMAFACGRGKQEIQMAKYGVLRGDNMPWCLPNQRVFWDNDDLETIRQKFKEWKDGDHQIDDQRAERVDHEGEARAAL